MLISLFSSKIRIWSSRHNFYELWYYGVEFVGSYYASSDLIRMKGLGGSNRFFLTGHSGARTFFKWKMFLHRPGGTIIFAKGPLPPLPLTYSVSSVGRSEWSASSGAPTVRLPAVLVALYSSWCTWSVILEVDCWWGTPKELPIWLSSVYVYNRIRDRIGCNIESILYTILLLASNPRDQFAVLL